MRAMVPGEFLPPVLTRNSCSLNANVRTVEVSSPIVQLPVKQVSVKMTRPRGCNPTTLVNFGGKIDDCDIFLAVYLHKGHEPPPDYIKCLFRPLSSEEKSNKTPGQLFCRSFNKSSIPIQSLVYTLCMH